MSLWSGIIQLLIVSLSTYSASSFKLQPIQSAIPLLSCNIQFSAADQPISSCKLWSYDTTLAKHGGTVGYQEGMAVERSSLVFSVNEKRKVERGSIV